MNAPQQLFPSRRACFWIEAVYAIPFLGQMQGSVSGRSPGPTARVAEPLRFRQITLAAPQRFFRLLALGDVADGTGDKRALLRLQGTETDLHGKLRAVFSPSIQLQTRTHGPHPRLREELRAVFGMSAPKSFRHQNFDLLAQEFFPLVPE